MPPPKPRTRANVKLNQALLLDGPISPPPTALPRITMKSYQGTKIEEVAALRLLLPNMVPTPYHDQMEPALIAFKPKRYI